MGLEGTDMPRLLSGVCNILLAALALSAVAQAPAGAEEEEAFQRAAQQYAGRPKPPLPPDVRRLKVHAETAVKVKDLAEALRLYADALRLAPWWSEGYHDRAIVLGDLGRYAEAIRDTQRFLRLEPSAGAAAAAQDRIYQWEFLGKRASTEDADWQAVAESGSAEQLKQFLEKYPSGRYASVAQSKLGALAARSAAAAARVDALQPFIGTWRERFPGSRETQVFAVRPAGDSVGIDVVSSSGMKFTFSNVRVEGGVLAFTQNAIYRGTTVWSYLYEISVAGPNQLSGRALSQRRGWIEGISWTRQ
jgi:tetratricopeptide (TPR) repeat protein